MLALTLQRNSGSFGTQGTLSAFCLQTYRHKVQQTNNIRRSGFFSLPHINLTRSSSGRQQQGLMPVGPERWAEGNVSFRWGKTARVKEESCYDGCERILFHPVRNNPRCCIWQISDELCPFHRPARQASSSSPSGPWSHWPALVDVVHSQRAHAEDEKHCDKHVVDGPDVVDLKEFTGGDEERHLQNIYCFILQNNGGGTACGVIGMMNVCADMWCTVCDLCYHLHPNIYSRSIQPTSKSTGCHKSTNLLKGLWRPWPRAWIIDTSNIKEHEGTSVILTPAATVCAWTLCHLSSFEN